MVADSGDIMDDAHTNSYWESRGLILAGMIISYIVPFPINIILLLGDLLFSNPKIPKTQNLFGDEEQTQDYTIREFIALVIYHIRHADINKIKKFMLEPVEFGKKKES
jgi:hypothetical protein